MGSCGVASPSSLAVEMLVGTSSRSPGVPEAAGPCRARPRITLCKLYTMLHFYNTMSYYCVIKLHLKLDYAISPKLRSPPSRAAPAPEAMGFWTGHVLLLLVLLLLCYILYFIYYILYIIYYILYIIYYMLYVICYILYYMYCWPSLVAPSLPKSEHSFVP